MSSDTDRFEKEMFEHEKIADSYNNDASQDFRMGVSFACEVALAKYRFQKSKLRKRTLALKPTQSEEFTWKPVGVFGELFRGSLPLFQHRSIIGWTETFGGSNFDACILYPDAYQGKHDVLGCSYKSEAEARRAIEKAANAWLKENKNFKKATRATSANTGVFSREEVEKTARILYAIYRHGKYYEPSWEDLPDEDEQKDMGGIDLLLYGKNYYREEARSLLISLGILDENAVRKDERKKVYDEHGILHGEDAKKFIAEMGKPNPARDKMVAEAKKMLDKEQEAKKNGIIVEWLESVEFCNLLAECMTVRENVYEGGKILGTIKYYGETQNKMVAGFKKLRSQTDKEETRKDGD